MTKRSRTLNPKVLYKTKREAEQEALRLLRRGFKTKIFKYPDGYSVGVYDDGWAKK